MVFAAIPLAFLFVAGLLLRLGWAGRTIGDHPVCRRCGFDLFGLPKGSAVCSECGADLTLRKAVRIGHREHRNGLLGTGVLLLLIALAWMTGANSFTKANIQPYKPLWWLARDVRGADVPTRTAALAEVVARFGAGKLSQRDIDSFTDRGLQLQGKATEPWVPAWGDWIEAVRAKGLLSDDRWQRYLEQAIVPQMKLRNVLRRGDQLPYNLSHANARLGRNTRFFADYKSVAWEVDSEKLPDHTGGGGFSISVTGSGGFGRGLDLEPILPRLNDGDHLLRATLDMTVGNNGPIAGRLKSVITGNFELRSATASTVTMVSDPTLRVQVEKAIRISQASFAPGSASKVFITVEIDGPPVGMGYAVSAVADGRTYELGKGACIAGTTGHGWGFMMDASGLTSPTVDLIFKPSIEAAAGTIDTYEIWDGEIVMRGVKLQRNQTPTTSPATAPMPAAKGDTERDARGAA